MASGLNFLYNLLYKDVTAKVIVNGFFNWLLFNRKRGQTGMFS